MGGVSLRGVIENRDRKRQIIDYRDLRFGNITPTDIDGMIEYHGKAFIYYEFKLNDAEMPNGQRISLEQSIKSHRAAGKQAIAILLEHNIQNWQHDIPAAQCPVREYYLNPKYGWAKPKQYETAYSLSKRFLEWVDAGCKLGA